MKRPLVFLAVILPTIGLLGLLGWALVRAQGSSFAGFGVNANFGEVPFTNPTPAPFTLTLLSGEEISLQGLRGKLVMIDFWASWCPPCRQEAPALARLDREYSEQGVVFLGVAVWDSESEVRAFIDRYQIPYANSIDYRGAIAIDFGVMGIPEKYFINREGRVVRKFIGPVAEERLREALDALLASE